MKRFSIILLALALGATAAFSYLGKVVGSFRAPHYGACGLAISNDRLYVGRCYSYPNRIYVCRPRTGSVYKSFPIYGGTDYCYGLAYSAGGYIWAADVEWGNVFRFDANTGSRYASWPTDYHPYGLAPRCAGDGGEGTTRLFGSDDKGNIYVHNMTTGSVYRSFTVAHPSNADLAYDWRNDLIWQADGESPYIVYGYRRNGAVAASFTNPHPNSLVYYGLTYRGEYLWLKSEEYPNAYIYRIHCPAGIGVEPASVGKVKALFR